MSDSILGSHQPSDIVCFGGSGARTAGQLQGLIERVGAALPAAPVGRRALVACHDRYWFMAGLLGALQAGWEVLLPPNGQTTTIEQLARSSGAVALLHDVPGGAGIDVAALDDGRASSAALRGDLVEQSVVLFTSGSTGRPEAHRKLVSQLLHEARVHVRAFGLEGRRVVAGVPPHHIYGLLFSVLGPLLAGGSVLRSTPLFPRELAGELALHRADVLVSVPPQLVALAQDAELVMPPLHRAFCSAGPLPTASHSALCERGLTITEILGSTETGGIAWRDQTDGLWQPLEGARIEIDADAVLWVDAPWLSPEQPRPYRTADRASRAGLGFRHLGRADAVTKIAGRRVDIGDVEACLRQVPGVRDARVIPVDAGGVRGLTLWAALEADEQIASTTLRSALARFDPVTHPKRFRCVPSLPRAPTGKVTRSALLSLFDTWELPFESLDDGTVRIDVPRNTGFVRGHFEGDPILPGVVQLRNIALAAVRRRYPDLRAVERLTRVKFKRIVLPGEVLTLSLLRKGSQQVQFSMQVGAEPACSGIFHFRDSTSQQVTEGDLGARREV